MRDATTQPATERSLAIRRDAAVVIAALPRARRGARRSVHRARVATRRLREALASAADALSQSVDAETRDLRRLTRVLGPVREMDVARLLLRDLSRRHHWPAAAVASVDAQCARRRDAAREKMLETLDRLDVVALAARLNDTALALELTPRVGAAPDILSARLRQRARALSRAARAAGTVYAAEPLHEVRIAAKKLRYAMELLGDGAPLVARDEAVRRLKHLQRLLGHVHDAQILQHQIQEVAATTADRRLVQALGGMNRTVESHCRAWHGQVLRVLPKIESITSEILRGAPARLSPRPARMSVEGLARPRLAHGS